MDTHFPPGQGSVTRTTVSECDSQWDYGSVMSVDAIKWAIDEFKPFKSPDLDGIYTAFLATSENGTHRNVRGDVCRCYPTYHRNGVEWG